MGTTDPAAIEAISHRKVSPTIQRQRRSVEFKRQIVEESFAPGASVARVARAHGVNANQVFNWRRLYRQGLLKATNSATPKLLAVHVEDRERSRRVAEAWCAPELTSGTGPEAHPKDHETHRAASGPASERAGTIQIDLPKGRLRISGAVDGETLRMVLEALRG